MNSKSLCGFDTIIDTKYYLHKGEKIMKKVAIVLLVLQALAIFGGIVNGSLAGILTGGIPIMLGYFLPGIIGVILLVKSNKRNIR